MTDSSIQNDTMTIKFFNAQNTLVENLTTQDSTGTTTIDNWTQINLENDYFIPSNGLTIVIEDDRVYQLTYSLERGFKVKCDINGNPVFIGYIFDYHLEYNRGGGTKLTIQCKDLLEYMAQGTMFPNMGTTSTTNYHFKATDTLYTALQTIANTFSAATSSSKIIISYDNSQDLTFATGFQVGVRSSGKTPKSRIKSLASNLNSLTTPMKNESYLAYMVRLAKMAGANLKMGVSTDNTIFCKPPTYDRDEPTENVFQLIHYLTGPNTIKNNVLTADFKFTLDKQPSVVIIEANTVGDNKFYQKTIKGVAINELTGYDFNKTIANGGTPEPIPNILDAISALTTGQLGTGYTLAPFNQNLFLQRAGMAIDIDTQVSLPYYSVSTNAHTLDECSFAASKVLSEQQDKYVEFTYRVQGWTMAGTNYVWQPDIMVNIVEEVFRPGGTVNLTFPMWIKRVNFIKSRGSGSETIITCSLPYTHNFEMTA